jgi:hypothetical protein
MTPRFWITEGHDSMPVCIIPLPVCIEKSDISG